MCLVMSQIRGSMHVFSACICRAHIAYILWHVRLRSLGSAHDASGNTCLTSDGFIMSPSLSITSDPVSNRNSWIFSSCSIDDMDEYITSLEA